MAIVFHHTAVRALLLAVILAGIAALTAPTARGADSAPTPAAHAVHFATTPVLADEWSWDGFVRFWRSQAGSMTGVLGTVMLVGAAAVILVLYKGKG